MPTRQNLIHLIRERAAADPERIAFVYSADALDPAGDEVLSYAQLDQAAMRVAAGLQQRFAPDDRLLVLNRSGRGFAVSFLGCIYAGMIAVPAPAPDAYQRQRGRLAAIAENAGAVAALTDAADLTEVRTWVKERELSAVRTVATDLADLPAEQDWRQPTARERTLAFLQYTSGSTSAPKGVMVDHGNILANADVIVRTAGVDASMRFGGWLPMYHDMGLIGLLLAPLILGSRSILMTPTAFLKRPHTWLHLITRHGINFSPAPNFAYDLCVRRIKDEELAGVDLSGWTHAVNGSEPIQARTLTAFRDRFAAVGLRPGALVPGYGMAEATLCVSAAPLSREPVITKVDADRLGRDEFVPTRAEAGTRHLVSSGRTPETDVRIVDPATREPLPDGRIGEIWVRGPSIARGYWADTETTSRTFGAVTAYGQAGFLRTGDLGVRYDGELYVTGRIKELLVVRGCSLYPQDIEVAVRAAHPALSGGVGAVFTVPNPPGPGLDDASMDGAGEQVVVVHECRPARRTPGELNRITCDLIDVVVKEFAVPVAAVMLVRPGSIPRTTSGKIQRALTRRYFLDGELEPIHSGTGENG